MNVKHIWNTGGRSSKPVFIPSGMVLDHIQFCYRNVCGAGARTKRGAIFNWIKQVKKELAN